MIDPGRKRRKLFNELLALVCLCFALSLLLFIFVTTVGTAVVEEYCFQHDILLDELEWYSLDRTLRGLGFGVSAVFFLILFFALFAERLAYIRKITAGVDSLRNGQFGRLVALTGNNELTELAEAVNYLSESEQKIKEKEKRLYEEREELIRSLSHDIRTPLTSIMSYTQLLSAKESWTEEERREYLELVNRKTAQIKELTDILLDGGRRNVEYFEDARLLFEQLAGEFEEELEETFRLSVTLPAIAAFSANFDVGELRRIFDNLISNIHKYADPTDVVRLSLSKTNGGVVIRQSNTVKRDRSPSESYKMGLYSIRRIAQNYGGTTEVTEADGRFEIVITLSAI